MASIKIALADLGDELRRLPGRDEEAIMRGVRRTMAVDAYRWFDWSVRGGGFGGSIPRTAPGPRKPKKPKPQVGLLKRVISRVKSILGMFRAKRTPPPKPPRAAKPPAPPQGYRPPIDTGDYVNSGRHEFLDDGAIFYSDASPPIKAGVIEGGRRPKPIPIQPLAQWVRRKLGVQDPKQAIGIAIAISKVAAKQRRPGLKVFERMHPKIAEAVAKNIARELRATRPGT